MAKKTKKKISQTAKHVTHTGALHLSVGFPGYSLNKLQKN